MKTVIPLHKLTDEFCSRWIAEKLGWRIVKKESTNSRYPVMYRLENPEGHARGNPGFFGWHWHETEEAAHNTMRDMVNDPAMTVMLLHEASKRAGFSVIVQIDPNGDASVDGLAIPVVYAHTLGRAVAEAFMLAHGYSSTGDFR